MNPETTFEYSTLGWVKPELENVIADAQTRLAEYVENRSEADLEKCIEHLQLIHGTLQMVEVYGAAMLAEEMQHTTAALLSGNVADRDDAVDILMGAMLQLPDYLDGVQAGRKDNPIALMPLMNDLRAVRKQNSLTKSILFSPDLENAELVSGIYDTNTIVPGKLQDAVKRVRTHYQLGLVDYIRNNKESAGLQRISAVLNSLEKVSSNDQVRNLWVVIGALVDGLANNGIEKNTSTKMLLGAVDRQLKAILDSGEEKFSEIYSRDLVSDALFYIALCTTDTKLISAVKDAYHLSDLIAQKDDTEAVRFSGLNADLLHTLSNGITEDIEQVKDALELFMHSADKDAGQLVSVADQLGKIADTYGMLGLADVRESLMEQRGVLQKIIDGEAGSDEQTVLGIASQVLNAESELKEFIAERSGGPGLAANSKVPAAEYRQVVLTVASEALKNFSDAKAAILSYVSGSGGVEQLEIILNRLEEVRGIAMLLPLGRVEDQLVKLQKYIRVALLDNSHNATEEEHDAIADTVSSIEYFIESLLEGRPGVEQGLDAGDKAIRKLESIIISYEGDEVADSEAGNIVDEEDSSAGVVELQVTRSDDGSQDSVSVPQEDEQQQYKILSEDADEEIVEIFIEEAEEVLNEISESLPLWKADSSNEDALSNVRRGFHTLKGSGRLLGAEMIGEFSWKFENMLNRLIDNKIATSEALYQAVDDALVVIPKLVEQIKGDRKAVDNVTELMSIADAIAEGREVALDTFKNVEEIIPHDANTAGVIIDDEQVFVDEIIEPFDIDDDSEITSLDESINIDIAEPVPDQTILIDDIETDDEVIDDELFVTDDEVADIGSIQVEELDENLVEQELLSDPYRPTEEYSIENDSVFEIDDINVGMENELSYEEDDSHTLPLSELAFEAEDNEELTELYDASESVNAPENINEEAETESTSGDLIDIDPVLLKIYHDESQGHIETVRQLLEESETNDQPLKADKVLLRAFHTLYGSARTAEVQPIAELTGTVEQFIKIRQDNDKEFIPDGFRAVIKKVEHAVSAMLETVVSGKQPVSNPALCEEIHQFVQQEIDVQRKKAEQDVALTDEHSIPFDSVDAQGVSYQEDMHATESRNDLQGDNAIQIPYGDIDDELIDIFLEEAGELLEISEDTLNKIKHDPDITENIHHLQRTMHTLKGGARMADLMPVGDLTHNLESLVDKVNDKQLEMDDTCFNLLQDSLDTLTAMLNAVRNRQPLPAPDVLIGRIENLIRFGVDEVSASESAGGNTEVAEPPVAESKVSQGYSESITDAVNEELEVQQSTVDNEGDDYSGNIVIQNIAERRQSESIEPKQEDRPHWGERSTDVNFKDTQEQVRVRSDLLNNLVNYAGEVNIFHARMAKQIADFGFNLSELTQTVERLKEQLRKLEIETEIQIRSGYEKDAGTIDDNFDPLEMDQYSTLQQLTRSLSETAGDVDSINEILQNITRDSETLLVQESRISSDLQEGLMRTRMVRFGGLSSRLRRIVRQVSRELGKDVELEIQGESSEVDRTVLDRIIAPLEHMLRNAIVHGIEQPEARTILGKSQTGKIVIRVDRQGSDVVIKVKDDGAGIDADKIRKHAVKRGMIAEDSYLSDRDTLQLILHSGFTTANEVTQVAGRGVGMDVVDSEIKQLGGILEIDTIRGRSTEFTIRLPLTLAINQALLVSAADDIYAIPLASIDGVVRVSGVELQAIYDSGNNQYEFNGVEYELRHLGALLNGNQLNYSKQLKLFPVLLVNVGEHHFALHVEDLVGRREIVVKPVGLQIGSVHGIAGATILADGRVVLILEMSALAVADSLFRSSVSTEVQPKGVDEVKTIMVVDDSITIRKITERILKRYGINVILAKDGVDATNLLQESIPDLILLDIEMPRMDGFEVASFIRNDKGLRHVPIIMITSRTGSKHKQKAKEIGVNKYLGKPFQEDDLIKNINKILKTSFTLS